MSKITLQAKLLGTDITTAAALDGPKTFNRYIPITKIDEEQRMVYGVATSEALDAGGEIIDYEATKRAVAEWAKWANIREMHGANAVGVATEIVLDDASRQLFIGVRVVDNAAWQKVKAGVYKGFSIGGKALKKILESTGGQVVRRVVEYLLNEISLVDRPANPSARFSLVKREGGFMDENERPPEEGEETAEETPAGNAEGDEAKAEGAMPASEEEVNGEQPPAEPEEQPMTMALVKDTVIAMLKELGLVREQIAAAAEVADLRKSLSMVAPASDLQKLQTDLAIAGSSLAKLDGLITKATGDMAKMLGDLVTVASAVTELEGRLEKVEQTPQGGGPVLREINLFGAGGALSGQGEAVLKSMIEQAEDPQTRQVLQNQLSKIQIQSVHQGGGKLISLGS